MSDIVDADLPPLPDHNPVPDPQGIFANEFTYFAVIDETGVVVNVIVAEPEWVEQQETTASEFSYRQTWKDRLGFADVGGHWDEVMQRFIPPRSRTRHGRMTPICGGSCHPCHTPRTRICRWNGMRMRRPGSRPSNADHVHGRSGCR